MLSQQSLRGEKFSNVGLDGDDSDEARNPHLIVTELLQIVMEVNHNYIHVRWLQIPKGIVRFERIKCLKEVDLLIYPADYNILFIIEPFIMGRCGI